MHNDVMATTRTHALHSHANCLFLAPCCRTQATLNSHDTRSWGPTMWLHFARQIPNAASTACMADLLPETCSDGRGRQVLLGKGHQGSLSAISRLLESIPDLLLQQGTSRQLSAAAGMQVDVQVNIAPPLQHSSMLTHSVIEGM